jgi:hypothetical protein
LKIQLVAAVVTCALPMAIAIAIVPGGALAYTISNSLSDGCHERITSEALRAARTTLATAAALKATNDEQALIDDLQFTPDADMKDLGGVTFLLGVRDNDLKGRGAQDLSQLAEVHGDPAHQNEHCLRAGDQKEPGGTAAAVSSCRAFIRGRVLEALAGLDASGAPDVARRTSLTVHLALRGQIDAPLPTYYVRMGQAVHAIQDSFTHTYRTSDEMKITTTLDWLDQVNGTLVESRDGPGHATALDRCDDPDALRKTRRILATEASTAVLRATLDPTKTMDQKIASVDGILDMYLSYSPGCTSDNRWCDAPENQYKNPTGCTCSVGRKNGGLWAALSGAVLAMLGMARRLRRRRWGRAAASALTMVGAVLLLTAGNARADSGAPKSPDPDEPTTKTTVKPSSNPSAPPTTTTKTTVPGPTPSTPATTATTVTTPKTTTMTVTMPTDTEKHGPPPPKLVPVAEPGPRDVTATAWGASLAASGSIDNPALAAALGLRMRLNSHWIFGLDGEANPWIGHAFAVRPGALNVYGTAIFQLPLAYEDFNVRSSVSLGASYLLMDLYGAPQGSLGLYADVSFLGLAWKLSRTFYLITNPLNIASPIPQLKGVPLTYPQYRFTLGLEVYLG